MTNLGAIEITEKIAELIDHAPAGGAFHDVTISEVGGLEVPGFWAGAGFSFQTSDGKTFALQVTREK